MEADHEQGAIGHVAGGLDHARTGGKQMDRRRRSTSVPQ